MSVSYGPPMRVHAGHSVRGAALRALTEMTYTGLWACTCTGGRMHKRSFYYEHTAAPTHLQLHHTRWLVGGAVAWCRRSSVP